MEKKHKHIESAIVITDFSSIASEAIQKLQTNIDFAGGDKKIKTIGITSSIQSEGKSTLIVNMANVYAFRGAKVCLVNLDLRRPTIHHFYGVKNSIGVTEYVQGDASIDDIIMTTDKGVDIICSGAMTPYPTKLLASSRMDELFEELRKRYDYILVDTTPVLLVADAMLCARFVEGYVFVCAQHYSKKKNVKAAINALRENGIEIIGLVMTAVTDFDRGTGAYDSYKYYYKSHEQGEEIK